MVALGGRSGVTDAFVAQRAGETWQLIPEQVDGNTVRGGLNMGAVSGPFAAARTQPHMAMTVARGGLAAAPSRAAADVAELGKGIDELPPAPPPKMMLGARPLVPAGEIASLAAVPDKAIVLATRGRVARRDVITLRPEYPSKVRSQSVRREVAASGAAGPGARDGGTE